MNIWKPGRWYRVIYTGGRDGKETLWSETSVWEEAERDYNKLDDASKQLQRLYHTTEPWLTDCQWFTLRRVHGGPNVSRRKALWAKDLVGNQYGVRDGSLRKSPVVVIETSDVVLSLNPEKALALARVLTESALALSPPPEGTTR